MTVFWITLIIVGILSVPTVLIWWRIADNWSAAEHKRFKPKEAPPKPDNAEIIPDPSRD